MEVFHPTYFGQWIKREREREREKEEGSGIQEVK